MDNPLAQMTSVAAILRFSIPGIDEWLEDAEEAVSPFEVETDYGKKIPVFGYFDAKVFKVHYTYLSSQVGLIWRKSSSDR
jgi:hypothetical protein